MASRGSNSKGSLSGTQLMAFGLPAMSHALVAGAVYTVLPTHYAANTAITLAQIGTVAGVSRVIDALNDPVMGFLSDRTRSRFGSRKPWIAAAIIFCVIAVFQLFSPPSDATWVYFLIWSQVLYTGFTMFEVPRSAWGAELSRDYNERARIGMFVGGFNILGALAFYLVPITLGLLGGSSKVDGAALHLISWVYAISMPIAVLLCLWLVPQGRKLDHKPTTLRGVGKTILRSLPARRLFTIVTLWGLGQGVFVGCAFIFYSYYMKLDEWFAMIMGLLFLIQVMALPLWSRILPQYDRHRVWAFCIGVAALLAPIALLLPKGEQALPYLFPLVIVQAFLMAPANFLPGAVLGDVIDYDTMKSGTNKAGNLFAVQMVLIKIAMALGGAVAFNLLQLVGYRVNQPNTDLANWGLAAIFLGIPLLFHLAMAALAWNFPLDRRRHGIITRRLQSRQIVREELLVPN